MENPGTADESLGFFGPLSLEETFFRVAAVFSQCWGAFLVVNTLSALLSYVLVALCVVFTASAVASGYQYDAYGDTSSTVALSPMWWIGLCVELVLFYVVHSLADGTNIRLAAEIYAGRVPQLSECFSEALRKLCPLVIACLLIAVMILVPAVLLFLLVIVLAYSDSGNPVPVIVLAVIVYYAYAIYIVIITYHTYPSIIVEGLGGFAGIGRSVQLNRGHFCAVLLILLLWFIMRSAVNALVSSISPHPSQGTYQGDSGVSYDLTFGSAGDGFLKILVAIFFAAIGSM